MKNEEIKSLENQIGDFGKLKHTEAYTGKPELSDEEIRSKNAFLNSIETKHDEVKIKDGWVPLDRNELGARSDFYPENWQFFIHPATVMAIKNWTSINEENLVQVNKVFNEIIAACVRITCNGKNIGWQEINSWDRFWFILKAREYTFSKGDTSIKFEDLCSECHTNIVYTLTPDALFYEYPDDDLIESFWNGSEWVINPKEYDVDHEPITLYIPTIGKDDAIIKWAVSKARAEYDIDEQFLTFLPWLIKGVSKNESMFNRNISKLYKEYKKWSIEFHEFMLDVITNITINPSEKLRVICDHCGMEATSNVRFPNGIKELFRTNKKPKKFGSR